MPDAKHGATVVELPFPEEWHTAAWIHCQVLLDGEDVNTGEKLVAAGGVLEDGSNLLGLAYPGGWKFVRTSPVNDWAIEERFKGQPPKAHNRESIEKVWRLLKSSVIKAKRRANAEESGG